jgi:hypothetical protein
MVSWVNNNMKANVMRESYDFSNSVKNPYAKDLNKQITIDVDEETLAYFQNIEPV